MMTTTSDIVISASWSYLIGYSEILHKIMDHEQQWEKFVTA